MATSKTHLSLDVFEKLRNIYASNKWEIDEEGSFNRFCEMLRLLTIDQQDCILRLTEIFLKFDLDVYRKYLKEAISKIDLITLSKYSKIYIMALNVIEEKIEEEKPLAERKKIGNSSDVIAYAFNDSDIRDQATLRKTNINVISSLDGLPRNFMASKGLLLLVDDFIGSGKTVETCIHYLTSVSKYDLDKIHILSLVAQREGIQRLKSQNITVYCSAIRPKGITENYQNPLRDKLVKAMEQIEDLLQVNNEFRFGYNRSEALVKMIRTPNNTFPFFWLKNKTKYGKKFIAPFPR